MSASFTVQFISAVSVYCISFQCVLPLSIYILPTARESREGAEKSAHAHKQGHSVESLDTRESRRMRSRKTQPIVPGHAGKKARESRGHAGKLAHAHEGDAA